MFLPIPVEKQYQKALLAIIKNIELLTKKIVVPALPGLEAQVKAVQDSRADAWAEETERLIASLAIQADVSRPIRPVPTAEQIGVNTNRWNDRQWRKVLKSTFGVTLFSQEPWLRDELKTFTAQNVTLIKSLEEDVLKDIEGTVQRGLQTGRRHEQIAKDLFTVDKGVFKKARTRAKLIARDQVSKLNGNLTRLRQTSLGVEEYIWHDSDDTRVRTTHQANDGKRFRWDTPPATGHPGEEVNCRCWAEAVFQDELFEELRRAA